MKLSVYWADEWKSIELSQNEWEAILDGNEFSKDGEGYYYEGKKFQDHWWFEGGLDGGLEIYYGDGGTGFIGSLSDEEVIKEINLD